MAAVVPFTALVATRVKMRLMQASGNAVDGTAIDNLLAVKNAGVFQAVVSSAMESASIPTDGTVLPSGWLENLLTWITTNWSSILAIIETFFPTVVPAVVPAHSK